MFWSRFSSRISLHYCINFFLKISCWPKTSLGIMLPPPCFTVGTGCAWWRARPVDPRYSDERVQSMVSHSLRALLVVFVWLLWDADLIGGVLPCALWPHCNARALVKWPLVCWLPPWLRNFTVFAQIGWTSDIKGLRGSTILPFPVALPQICASGFGGLQTVMKRTATCWTVHKKVSVPKSCPVCLYHRRTPIRL